MIVSLDMVLSEELDIWKCSNHVLVNHLPELCVHEELVPWALGRVRDMGAGEEWGGEGEERGRRGEERGRRGGGEREEWGGEGRRGGGEGEEREGE